MVVGLTAGPPAPSAALGSLLIPSTHRSAGPTATCVSGAQQGQDPLPAQREQRPPGPRCVGTGGLDDRQAPQTPIFPG